MKKILIFTLLLIPTIVHGQNIRPLDQWTSTTTPKYGITPRSYGQQLYIPATTTTATSTFGGNLDVTGNIKVGGNISAPVALTLSGFTTGSALFVGPSGTIAQDNSNFYWDNTSNRLGIGTTTPTGLLNTFSSSGGYGLITTGPSGGTFNSLTFRDSASAGTDRWIQYLDAAQGMRFYSGGDKLTLAATGNVGVGTTTPQQKLSIATNTNNYGLTQSDGTVIVGTYVGSGAGVPLGGFYGTKTAHPLYFFTADGNPSQTILTNGNVGIGTTSPMDKLHIVPNANSSLSSRSEDSVRIGRIAAGRPALILDTSDTTYTNRSWYMENRGSTGSLITGRNGLDVLTLGNSGNVGVGTTSPAYKMDVYGDLRVGVIGTTANTLYANSATGKVGIGTNSPAYGILQLNSPTYGQSNDLLSLSTMDGTYNSRAVISHVTAVGLPSYVKFDSTYSSGWGAGNWVFNTGNVGVGTTTPSQRLSVQGNALISGDIFAANITATGTLSFANLLVTSSSTLQNFTFVNATGTSATTTNFFSTNASSTNLFSSLLTVGGTGLVVNSSRNVGIGTVAPVSALEVKSSQSLMLTINGTTAGARGINFQHDGTSMATSTVNSASGEWRDSVGSSVGWGGHRTFYTDTVERMRITSTGNVGIGTTNPLVKLQVSQTNAATTNLTNFFNTSDNQLTYSGFGQSAANGRALSMFWQDNSDGVSGYGGLSVWGDSNTLVLKKGGNVGIGTTTVKTKLVVQGDAYLATSTAATASGLIMVATDGTCHRIVVSTLNVISASTVSCP